MDGVLKIKMLTPLLRGGIKVHVMAVADLR